VVWSGLEDVIFQKKIITNWSKLPWKVKLKLKEKTEWVEQNKRKQRKKNGRKVKHKWKQMSSHIVENRYSHEQCAYLLCLHWNLVFFYVSDSACFQCSTNKDKSKLLLHKLDRLMLRWTTLISGPPWTSDIPNMNFTKNFDRLKVYII
jgi:hypothetical protein